MKRVSINVDIGEGMPHDAQLLKYATRANVGCGAHAGSKEITLEAIRLCRKEGVIVGAHPGYPDPAHMGRTAWPLENEEQAHALYQNLSGQLRLMEGMFEYIKPHGAFYHQAQTPGRHAGLLTALLAAYRNPLLGTAGTTHERAAAAVGVKLIKEGFADRRYLDSGGLAPRTQADAMLTDAKEIREQTLRLAGEVDSICVHGDSDHCLEVIKVVRAALEEAGFEVGG